jgi:hypothetical protein
VRDETERRRGGEGPEHQEDTPAERAAGSARAGQDEGEGREFGGESEVGECDCGLLDQPCLRCSLVTGICE